MVGDRKRPRFSLCWDRRWVNIRTHLERSAYVCGESLRLKAEIDNQSGEDARLKLRLVQVNGNEWLLFIISVFDNANENKIRGSSSTLNLENVPPLALNKFFAHSSVHLHLDIKGRQEKVHGWRKSIPTKKKFYT